MNLIEIAQRGCEAHARYDEICTTLDEDDPERERTLLEAAKVVEEAIRQAAAIPHTTEAELNAKLMLLATCVPENRPGDAIYALAQSSLAGAR